MDSGNEIKPAFSLNCRGQLLDLRRPLVMGILNATPDSFFADSRAHALDAALRRAEQMVAEGADILDVGGASSRPGATEVPPDVERARVVPIIEALSRAYPGVPVSIDTWRASVAEAALDAGARLLNDISAGSLDPDLYAVAARHPDVPYILMHMQGRPETMQQAPEYESVVTEVLDFFIREIARLQSMGVYQIVLDPGFGFGKTVAHNFALLRQLNVFGNVCERPVLAGVSRKSMINKVLHIKAEDALNGTTALHMAALLNGASLLRVHDVREAVEVVKLHAALSASEAGYHLQ